LLQRGFKDTGLVLEIRYERNLERARKLSYQRARKLSYLYAINR